MKPLNHAERRHRWIQFLLLYAGLLALTAGCWWLALVLLPRLASSQRHQTAEAMQTYRRSLTGPDRLLAAVEGGAPLTDNWLRNLYASTDDLDGRFPEPLFRSATNSYRQLAAEYENVRRQGDQTLRLLVAQRTQLNARKAELLAALAAADAELSKVRAPKPPVIAAAGGGAKPPLPKPAPPAGPLINAGTFGPYKPLLVAGNGEFGHHNPLVNAAVQFLIVGAHRVMLGVYFETGEPTTSTLAKVSDQKEVYAAPPGYRITGLSVPERTPWRISYVDKTAQPDFFTLADGLMSLSVLGKPAGPHAGIAGSALTIQLKKPITVQLEKE